MERKLEMMKEITGSAEKLRLFFLRIAATILICLSIPVIAFAGFGSDNDPETETSVFGYIELNTLINTFADQDFSDAVKKNELHYHLETKYGTRDFYFFTAPDFYFNPNLTGDDPAPYRYSGEQHIANNLRISDENYEIAMNELFVNYTIYPVRLRLGNQLYKWGTADVINPTAYFAPYDFREFLFRESDELKQGVPSLSAMYFNDRFTAEMVMSFLHVPTLFAPSGNFWSLDMREDVYKIRIPEAESLDPELSNAGYGIRLAGTFFRTDLSLSFYHGPDREPVLVPSSDVEFPANEPLLITVDPKYYIVNTIGMDLSKSVGDFTFQAEAAYTPDKSGFVNQDLNHPSEIQWPLEIRKSEHLAYALGFNYYIPISKIFESHSGDLVFTTDWYQSHYFDEDLYGAYISDLLTFRLQDSYLDGRLNFQLTSIFETKNGGRIFWPEVWYDFPSGWSVRLAYGNITGESNNEPVESLFYHFKDNDFVSLKIRYRL